MKRTRKVWFICPACKKRLKIMPPRPWCNCAKNQFRMEYESVNKQVDELLKDSGTGKR